MKKHVVKNIKTQECVGKYDSKPEAAESLLELIEEHNEDLSQDDEGYLTPFDFVCEEIESKEINEEVVSFEDAIKYLGKDFIQHKCELKIGSKHVESVNAYVKLVTIAEAWNKADGFVPDFSNHQQYKYFPWFYYDKDTAGFVFSHVRNAPAYTYASFGSRLCFKTRERARQFGKQFESLWNDFLL